MILNLTLNPSEHFGSAEVGEYKRDEVWDLLAVFWDANIPDYIRLSKMIAELAKESGFKKAVIEVPAYAASVLETELMMKGIAPYHYFSGQFVDTKAEKLLENLYEILEAETAGGEDIKKEEPMNVDQAQNVGTPVQQPTPEPQKPITDLDVWERIYGQAAAAVSSGQEYVSISAFEEENKFNKAEEPVWADEGISTAVRTISSDTGTDIAPSIPDVAEDEPEPVVIKPSLRRNPFAGREAIHINPTITRKTS